MARHGYAPRQDAILFFIIDYKRENNGAPPTYQEIADHFGIPHKKNVYNLVQRLVQKGRLAFDDKMRIVVPRGKFVLKGELTGTSDVIVHDVRRLICIRPHEPSDIPQVRLCLNRKYHPVNEGKLQELHRLFLLRRQWNQIKAKLRSTGQLDKMCEQQKNLCWWCGKKLDMHFHVDHRVPLSRGGSNNVENLCLSCPDCNLAKGDKMPWEFNGRLL